MAKTPYQSSPLWHMDFVPRNLQRDKFDTLMSRANSWLMSHPNMRVKTAETRDIKYKPSEDPPVDTERTTFTSKCDSRMCYVRVLRIWVVPRQEGQPVQAQQIGHYNIIPASSRDYDQLPVYESFAETMDRLNARLKTNPIPGRVLNLETLETKYHTRTSGVEPNESYWERNRSKGTSFLHILRVFYEIAYPLQEEIGFADFKPRLLQGGEGCSSIFESFGGMVATASRWIKQNQNLKVISVQSVNYKVKGSAAYDPLDTHRTMHWEGADYTKYLRIIRIGYVVTRQPISMQQHCILTYKTFLPASRGDYGYETFSELIGHVNYWLDQTGVNVLSVETVPVRLEGGRQDGDPEAVFTRIHGEDTAKFLKVVRCYFSTPYTEPAARAFRRTARSPRQQEYEEEEADCCHIV